MYHVRESANPTFGAEYALLNLEASGIYFGTEKFTFTHGVGFLIGSGTEALERMSELFPGNPEYKDLNKRPVIPVKKEK